MATIKTIKETIDFVKNPKNIMSFDKSFMRMNGQPLDKSSIFDSIDNAKKYLTEGIAYEGQIISVQNGSDINVYVIEAGELKELTKVKSLSKIIVPELDGPIEIEDKPKTSELEIRHKKMGLASGYDSKNATTTIGPGETKTIQLPQFNVEPYGHVTKAIDQPITITIPPVPTPPDLTPYAKKTEAIGEVSQDASNKNTIHVKTVSGTSKSDIVINNVAHATSADNDGSGNPINGTYAKLNVANTFAAPNSFIKNEMGATDTTKIEGATITQTSEGTSASIIMHPGSIEGSNTDGTQSWALYDDNLVVQNGYEQADLVFKPNIIKSNAGGVGEIGKSLIFNPTSEEVNITLPDKSGTVALTSDIPTIPSGSGGQTAGSKQILSKAVLNGHTLTTDVKTIDNGEYTTVTEVDKVIKINHNKGLNKTYTQAKSTPTISGNGGSGTINIPKINVDEYGHITAAENETVTITLPDVPKLPNIVVTPDKATGEHPDADEVVVLQDISASGHTITQTGVKVPTKKYVDELVAGAVQYLGVVNKPADLGKNMPTGTTVKVGKGDFYRVGTAFDTFKIGDLLIANKDDAGSTIGNYDRVIQEDYKGTVTSVGATGDNKIEVGGGPITSSGTITIKHKSGDAPSKLEGFYKFSTDDYSHVNSVKAVEKADITGALGYTPYNETNPNGYTSNKGTVTNVTAGTGLNGGSITSTGTISLKTSTATEIGGGKAVPYNGVIPAGKNYAIQIDNGGHYFVEVPWQNNTYTVNDGRFTVTGGAGLTGSGSGTANQASNTTATLAVGAGTGITVNADNVAVTDYNNLLTSGSGTLKNELGEEIILNCGGADDGHGPLKVTPTEWNEYGVEGPSSNSKKFTVSGGTGYYNWSNNVKDTMSSATQISMTPNLGPFTTLSYSGADPMDTKVEGNLTVTDGKETITIPIYVRYRD